MTNCPNQSSYCQSLIYLADNFAFPIQQLNILVLGLKSLACMQQDAHFDRVFSMFKFKVELFEKIRFNVVGAKIEIQSLITLLVFSQNTYKIYIVIIL